MWSKGRNTNWRTIGALAGAALLWGCGRDEGAAAHVASPVSATVASGESRDAAPAAAQTQRAAAPVIQSPQEPERLDPSALGDGAKRAERAALGTGDTEVARERLARLSPAAEKSDTQTPDAISAAQDARAKLREQRARERAAERKEPKAADRSAFPVKVSPDSLDLGQIPVGDSGVGSLTLRNSGEQPVVLKECKSSCGCTAVDCPDHRSIAPGEELCIEVSMRSDPIKEPDVFSHRISKIVTLIFEGAEGDEKIVIVVEGESVAYVVAEPTYLDPLKDIDGRVVLTSRDGEPFRLIGMTPPIIDELPQDAAAEHVVHLNWQKWEELGSELEFSFQVEHPHADRIAARVRPHAVRSRGGAPALPMSTTGGGPAVDGRVEHVEKIKASRGGDALLRAGDVEAVVTQIKAGELDVNAVDKDGASPLARVVRWGNVDMVKALLEHGASIDAADSRGRTPLMVAAQSGQSAIVRTLVEAGASIAAQDSIGTPLCWAAAFGNGASVEALIVAGSDVNLVSARSGYTPLIWAAGFGEAESLPPLIVAGAGLEAKDTMHGCTALMHAAGTGGPQKVRALLDAGAQVEARDSRGRTPLLMAAATTNAKVETLEVLVGAGAAVGARDNAGASALDLARRRQDESAAAVIEYLEHHLAPAPGS